MVTSEAFKQVLAKGGLDYQVRDSVVFVFNPKTLDNDMNCAHR